MSKTEFLEKLEALLFDISKEEREEALRYYENYFSDAGTEKEKDIIEELVSPEFVAKSIKESIQSGDGDRTDKGFYTERGYEDDIIAKDDYALVQSRRKIENENDKNSYTERDKNSYSESYQYSNKENYRENYNQNNNKNNSGLKTVLFILIFLMALPIALPIFITILSLLFVVVITVASIWVAFLVTSLALLISGFGVAVFGIIRIFTLPAVGFYLTGAGLAVFGAGMLFTAATIFISTRVLPLIIKGIKNFCRLPFQRRRATA